jgi:hypothetical protein
MTISFPAQLLILGIFGFLMWLFVFRRYRSLGLRMFFVFSMVSLMGSFWFYNDLQDQKSMTQNGQRLNAKLLRKWVGRSGENSRINLIEVHFELPAGQQKTITTSEYISDEEHAALQVGQMMPVFYNPVNQQVYYVVSLARYQSQKWIFYVFIGFFFVLGCVLWYFLRDIMVGVHEDTGDEYLEIDGKIVLDEKGNDVARTMKRVNTVSKLFQAFR